MVVISSIALIVSIISLTWNIITFLQKKPRPVFHVNAIGHELNETKTKYTEALIQIIIFNLGEEPFVISAFSIESNKGNSKGWFGEKVKIVHRAQPATTETYNFKIEGEIVRSIKFYDPQSKIYSLPKDKIGIINKHLSLIGKPLGTEGSWKVMFSNINQHFEKNDQLH